MLFMWCVCVCVCVWCGACAAANKLSGRESSHGFAKEGGMRRVPSDNQVLGSDEPVREQDYPSARKSHVSACVCVCVCVCVHVCICVCICVCVHAYTCMLHKSHAAHTHTITSCVLC